MLIRSTGPRDWRLFFADDLKIFHDGAEIKSFIEADDEAGYLVRYKLDDRGRPVVDRDRFVAERLEGTVVFTGTRRFSPDDAKAAAQAKRDRRQIRNIAVEYRRPAQGGAA